MTNDELTERTGVEALHDTVATRRRRFSGHVLRLPTTRPVSLSTEWAAEGGEKRIDRPKTRQETTNEDLNEMGLERKNVKSVKWRTLVVLCSSRIRRN